MLYFPENVSMIYANGQYNVQMLSSITIKMSFFTCFVEVSSTLYEFIKFGDPLWWNNSKTSAITLVQLSNVSYVYVFIFDGNRTKTQKLIS